MDYNFSRGKILFWDTISKQSENLPVDQFEKIKEVAKGFENSVAIMPDDENNIYAAKRLADAILNTDLSQQNQGAIDTITTNVLVKYFSQAQNVVINKSHFIPENSNISGNFGKIEQGIADDFESELRSNFEQEIDLLEDLQSSELSIEGLRKKLIIPSNFNAETDELPKFENEVKLGKIYFNNHGEIEKVECPFCNKFDVFFVSLDKYGCLECDKQFIVPMEIGDNLS